MKLDGLIARTREKAGEREVAKELNDKYGSGNLDPETGVFTPNS